MSILPFCSIEVMCSKWRLACSGPINLSWKAFFSRKDISLKIVPFTYPKKQCWKWLVRSFGTRRQTGLKNTYHQPSHKNSPKPDLDWKWAFLNIIIIHLASFIPSVDNDYGLKSLDNLLSEFPSFSADFLRWTKKQKIL